MSTLCNEKKTQRKSPKADTRIITSLAYAQAYIALAKVFRRFDFALYETTRRDVTIVRDCFNGQPWRGSKGVRGRVMGLRS